LKIATSSTVIGLASRFNDSSVLIVASQPARVWMPVGGPES